MRVSVGHIDGQEVKKKSESKSATRVSRDYYGSTEIQPLDSATNTEQILDLMKHNYEQEKRNREVQRSFMEERAEEEKDRHEELVKAGGLYFDLYQRQALGGN